MALGSKTITDIIKLFTPERQIFLPEVEIVLTDIRQSSQ